MTADQLTRWIAAAPWLAALVVSLLLLTLAATCYLIVRRAGGYVLGAGIGAMVCTGYSGDTSWRFARDHLGMTSHNERVLMFAAGEIALLTCAIMARGNKKATATDDSAGTPGVPGVLVWCITSVQLVPAFAESGWWAGIVRAAFGPVMAALLWHQAMGLEIRVAKPQALSSGLLAQIGHELRERLLSYLGLAVRGRTAAQVTRDRATARAVRLASRRWLGPWGRAALKASVARAAVGTSGEQRYQLLQLLAARRSADQLRTLDVVSPWAVEPALEPHPATPLGVTGAQLRRMDPIDAIRTVRAAHPDATPAELASITTEYGVPVSETQVRLALRASAAHRPADAQPILAVKPKPVELAPQPQPAPADDFETAAAAALAVAQQTEPEPAAATDAQPKDALVLDLAPMHPVRLELVEGNDPLPPTAQPQPPQVKPAAAAPRPRAAAPRRSRQPVAQLRAPDADAELLDRARTLNVQSLEDSSTRVSLRVLQRELGIGQRRAQRIQAQLPETLAAAQPPAKEA